MPFRHLPGFQKLLQDIKDGTWNKEDLWWLTAEKAALLGGSFDQKVNAKFVDALDAVSVSTPDLGTLSVYDLVMKRLSQMEISTDEFDPFVGPIKDNKGNERIPAGVKAAKGELLSIDYYVENVVGDIPR